MSSTTSPPDRRLGGDEAGASEATGNDTGASEATGNVTGASEATGNVTGASEATGDTTGASEATEVTTGASDAGEGPADRDSMHDDPALRVVVVWFLRVVGAFAAAVVVAQTLESARVLAGVPNPGALVNYGLPVVLAVGQLSAAIGFGSLVFAAFFVPPQRDGLLDVGGYRAVRAAGASLTVWMVCALLMIPLTASDVTGAKLSTVLELNNLRAAFDAIESLRYWFWTAIFAGVAALVGRLAIRWGWSFVGLAFAFLSLMPSALLGHSSSGGGHDIATNSLILHITAASLWTGGLIAVLAYAFAGGRWRSLALSRYSRVAFWCLIVTAFSGVINALVRVHVGELFTTTYGLVLVAKTAALLIAAGLGAYHRTVTLAAMERDESPARSLFVRFALVETVVLAVAMGLAAGLSRTAPPERPVDDVSITARAIGYDLDGPPTFVNLMTQWRFDLIFGTAAIVAAVVYLRGVWRLRRRGDAWPVGRTVAWLLGCFALLLATSSGLGKYAPALFSVHMMGHMMLSMLVPVLLVLGGPVTLALRALPPAGKDAPPGPREWILAGIHSRYSRFVTHPAIAIGIFVGSFYVLYLFGLFDVIVEHHSAHLLMNLHFLLSGYLFYWLVIGIDPAPRQVTPLAKVGIVWGALPFHAFFGVALMMTTSIVALDWYQNLHLGFPVDVSQDQQAGGGIAWATGEFPLVLVMMALLIQWRRQDDRVARRLDRQADRDDDAELESYNAMLRQMQQPAAVAAADDADDAAEPGDQPARH